MGKYSVNKLPSEIIKEISNKLRKLRKEGKLSQVDLARRSGVSLGSIKRFESTGQISLESFLKLLLILDRLKDIETILESKDDKTKIEDLFSNKTKR